MTPGPPPAGITGRADLLRALAAGEGALAGAVAALLGYREVPGGATVPGRPDIEGHSGGEPGPVATLIRRDAGAAAPAETLAEPPAAETFWCLVRYQPRTDAEIRPEAEPEPAPAPGPLGWTHRPAVGPSPRPLALWPDLRCRLDPALALPIESGSPDLARLAECLCRGHFPARLPRLVRRRLAPAVQIVFDRSEHLVPYWDDQERVARALARVFPPGALSRAVHHEGLAAPRLLDAADPGYALPPPGGLVLVLGDLGCLAQGDAEGPWLAPWIRLGRRLGAAGCGAVALVPCRVGRVPVALRRWWRVVAWERAAGAWAVRTGSDDPGAGTRRLLCALAPAVRIEPGLLRALRLALADPGLDAGAESEVWQDPALASTHSEAATLNPRRVPELAADFAKEPPQIQARLLAQVRAWRAGLAPEVWFEEVLNLPPAALDLLPEPADLDEARRFFAAWCVALAADPQGPGPGGDWMRRVFTRAQGLWQDPEVGAPLVRLDWAMHGRRAGYRPPVPVDPGALPPLGESLGASEAWFVLVQDGEDLILHPWHPDVPPVGTPLGLLTSANRLVLVGPVVPEPDPFWEGGEAPDWATDWGWDRFGAWVEFVVTGRDGARVVQRMRWIEPGTFLMGSPEDEPGRFSGEGPRHRVTISQGFWLADTPCTQALWEAVTGQNPSYFKSPDRPVEQVSWDACQGFIGQLNDRVLGLDLALPTEAQWEYACRAGSKTALYTGPIKILGTNNAPALDPIAWYGGNSGVGFDLSNGYDSSGWSDKQYPDSLSGTHPVGRKQPNAWGLYDMLGNVWEWCLDGFRTYGVAPVVDPVGPLQTGERRVLRGGSWLDGAVSLRWAYRRHDDPGDRIHATGFRLALGPSRASPASPARTDGAERHPRVSEGAARLAWPGPRSGSGRAGPGVQHRVVGLDAGPAAKNDTYTTCVCSGVTRCLDGTGPLALGRPDPPAVRLCTDRVDLTLRQVERPAWASTMGRDTRGLWADLSIRPGTAEPDRGRRRWWWPVAAPARPGVPVPVTQRLRWVPPGRFLMGSPPDEPGRQPAEGPRHPVTLERGFWLFDTPCTQALWSAVMGTNPSRFQDPGRPVESISWDQVQAFLARIADLIPGLILTLPTEAQWEYACRAGTETALYSGPIELLGRHQAPALDPIAWYAGNSGLDHDPGETLESRSDLWSGEHPATGTRRVKAGLPNPWGLYDMLGNVWEWVADPWHDDYRGAPADGSPWDAAAPGTLRVARGGAWCERARACRCASRYRFDPAEPVASLGFRCAGLDHNCDHGAS